MQTDRLNWSKLISISGNSKWNKEASLLQPKSIWTLWWETLFNTSLEIKFSMEQTTKSLILNNNKLSIQWSWLSSLTDTAKEINSLWKLKLRLPLKIQINVLLISPLLETACINTARRRKTDTSPIQLKHSSSQSLLFLMKVFTSCNRNQGTMKQRSSKDFTVI